MPLSVHRLAHNQVIFREVNERLRELAEAVSDGEADYICECSSVDCRDTIELKLFEYESVRARPKCFFVVPGHERLEVERIVDELARYTIVEKIVPLDGGAVRALASTGEAWSDRGLGGAKGPSEAVSGVSEALRFHVDLQHVDGRVCVVSVEGELDLYTGPVFERALTEALADGSGSVIVDLTQCPLIDSTGLGLLVKANKRLNRRGDPRIAVACPNPRMRRVFEITALHRFLVLHSTLPSALESARR